MAGGFDGTVVAQELMLTFRCSTADCNQVIAQAHSMSMAVFRVLGCPKCGKGTQVENGPHGWTVRQLPSGVAPRGLASKVQRVGG